MGDEPVIRAPRPLPVSLSAAFTLVEVLVSCTVLALILILVAQLTSHVARVTSSSHTAVFQEARTAFETINRLLSQAVLNTYWDYDNPGVPKAYVRASELHFLFGEGSSLTALPDTAGSAIFFQAPVSKTEASSLKSLPGLLNAIGFYVRFSASEDLPAYLQDKKPDTAAYRLWIYQQPTENLKVYSLYSGNSQAVSNRAWFRDDITEPARNHVLANHVFLLLIRCQNPNSGNKETYLYDSRPKIAGAAQTAEIHQFPPSLHVTLAAIDEPSASRLLKKAGGARYTLVDDNLFKDADDYREDIVQLKHDLDAHVPRIQYRLFEATINLESAKWNQ